MSFRNLRRAPGCSAPALFLSAFLLLAPMARAADEFPVTPAQMQALGVTLVRLDKPSDIGGQVYAARVILPPSREHVVSSPLAGLVERLLVGENDVVGVGQPLLRLVGPELGELQLKLLEASSKSRLSQKALEREKKLLAEGIIPERRVQEAEAASAEDRARVQQTEAALRLAGVDGASITRIAAGGVPQDGVTLHAKAAGTVVALEVKPGQRVDAADALMRLADTRQLWLDIQLPIERRNQVSVKGGGPITVVGRDVTASATGISSMVSDNQTVALRAQVTKGAEHLRPGEFVQVQVPFASGAAMDSWPVPVRSVVRQDDKAYVFVRTQKGFVATPVTVLNSAGQSVQVRGPLKPGQEIASGSVIALKAAWLGKSGSN